MPRASSRSQPSLAADAISVAEAYCRLDQLPGRGGSHGKQRGSPGDLRRLRDSVRAIAIRALNELAGDQEYRHGELARALLETELVACAGFWIAIMNGVGDFSNAPLELRMRASENIGNRGGLPVVTQLDARGDAIPAKLFELPTSSDGNGFPVSLPIGMAPVAGNEVQH